MLWLGFQSCGVIYGDIGTSPLYVFSSTFTSQPSWDDLVGALSIILGSLTLIVSVKYVCIVLAADDDGQGGTFALYSLLVRYVRIAKPGPSSSLSKASPVRLQRYKTGDMRPEARSLRRFLESSPGCQRILKLVGVLGVSMVMADGGWRVDTGTVCSRRHPGRHSRPSGHGHTGHCGHHLCYSRRAVLAAAIWHVSFGHGVLHPLSLSGCSST